MRVLYNAVGNLPVFADRGGAIERLVGEQMVLLKDKLEVSLFGMSDVPLPGVTVYENPIRFASMRDMWLRTPVVLGQLLRLQTDVIVSTHGLNVFSSFLYAKLRRKVYVAWELDHVKWLPPFTFPTRLYHLLIKSADVVVTLSDFHKRRLTERGLRKDRIHVIPAGVDTAVLSPCLADEKLNVLLCVAKFAEHKNQLRVLRAFKRCLDDGFLDKYRLVFVGPKRSTFGLGGDESYFRECVRYVEQNELRPYVEFTGYVDWGRLVDIFRTSKMFLLLSTEESFGLVVAQAMASGLVCIVSSIGPLPEVIGPAGIAVNPDDVDSVAAHMVHVLSDPILCRRYTLEARQRAEQCFNMRVTADRAFDLYRSVGHEMPAQAN